MISALLFENETGQRSDDPLKLTGPVPEVDLRALGLFLAPPAMLGEFAPDCPWKGIARVHPDQLPFPSAAGRVPPRVAFTRSMEGLTARAEKIRVMVSGGLDSLAVLVCAVQIARGRQVVAFTTDLTDDVGGSAAAVVRQLLSDLELPVDLVVLNPSDRAEPRWTPAGPRLDAMPKSNAAAAARAAELGIDILLSGDGADELLGVPRFATAAVAARWGVAGATRYLRDVAGSGPGGIGELAGIASRFPTT